MASAPTSPSSFAVQVLQGLGDQPTPQDVAALDAVAAAEGGAGPQFGVPDNTANYNPWNTTQQEPGSIPVNTAGVQSYRSWPQGVDATVATLEQPQPGYAAIRSALAQGNSSQAVEQAWVDSAWGTKSVAGVTPSTYLPNAGANPAGGPLTSFNFTGATTPAPSSSVASAQAQADAPSPSSTATPTTAAQELSAVSSGAAPAPSLLSSILGGLFGSVEGGILDIVLTGVFVLVGLGLIVLGVSRLFPGTTRIAPLAALAA
ncbi:MAG TPA: hypothetical protein VFN61_04545 [Acidimicrobiales bacterium]|nr:hypothetical protein [Acidimicrobiales bacterium]